MLMSGLFTPVGSMPSWAQKVTYAFPPRHFIDILRSVYLKGTSIGELWISYLALSILAVLFCSLPALTYKKRG
jgi:ABC-2 type transport system permease protein